VHWLRAGTLWFDLMLERGINRSDGVVVHVFPSDSSLGRMMAALIFHPGVVVSSLGDMVWARQVIRAHYTLSWGVLWGRGTSLAAVNRQPVHTGPFDEHGIAASWIISSVAKGWRLSRGG